jgi:signal transduction histidine kinase
MNMLAFSRQRSIEPEITPLGALVEECAQLLEPQCTGRGVALIVDHDPEMPPLALDASLIHQAVMNLLTNAVEAVENNRGVVTVRTMYHAAGARGPGTPGVAEIVVIDNGPGIPRDRLPRLFEPFNTTKGARGTGLGLAVTKRIVEEHKGVIRVESTQGQGATFRVILPADVTSSIDPSQTAQPREPRG